MKIEKINIIRVWVDENFYVDITPDKNYFNFWLYNKKYGNALYMFGTACSSEPDAIELAKNNAPDYIKIYNMDLTE